MRIAVLNEGRDPIYGGGQMHVKHLCEGLVRDHGCYVDLFVRALRDEHGHIYTQNESLLSGKWNIIRTGFASDFFSFFYRILRLFQVTRILFQKAKKEKYDLIHAHALLPGLPAKIVGFWLGIPVIYTVHGTMLLDSGKRNFLALMEKFLVTQISYDLEISVSRKIFEYPNVNTNIHIIYNGVDLKTFESHPFPKKKNGLRFLTVARIDRQKNHAIVLEALKNTDPELLEEKKFHRTVVGDGVLKQELNKKIQEYGLGRFVTLKGKLFGDDVIHEYKAHDVFLLPSLSEGQPLTLLEAFASKLPVLCTDVGDNTAFISSRTGWLMPAGDEAALRSTLHKILKLDAKKLQKMGENGYDFVQKYDRSHVVKKTFQCYQKIV